MIETLQPLFRGSAHVLVAERLSSSLMESLPTYVGRRVLLMIDDQLAEVAAIQDLITELRAATFEYLLYPVAVSEPEVTWVDDQVRQVRDFRPDVVVGVGGGSLIDLAKAVSVLIYNDGPAAEYQGPNKIKQPGARKIMVPTTAGTGSEVTPGAVVVNRETGRKGAISSPYVMPDLAILEPSLTLTMPDRVMAATALDALTHCLESYVGRTRNPFARMYAREGFRKLINAYPRACADPGNLAHRLEMLIGSSMAGFAIFNSDTGACHSMAYPLGTYHGVPHGLANALMIPAIMAHNIRNGCHRYGTLYRLYDDHDPNLNSAEEQSWALCTVIRDLVARSSLPGDLGSYGVTMAQVPFLAEKGLLLAGALANNPVPFTYDHAVAILRGLVA